MLRWRGKYTNRQNKIKEALHVFNEKNGKYKFDIVPVAGKFDIVKAEYNRWSNAPKKKLLINFFNGVNLKNPSGKRIVLTNKALLLTTTVVFKELDKPNFNRVRAGRSKEEQIETEERILPLEQYWANLLAMHDKSVKPENVKFIGRLHSNGTAGINCLGAPRP